SAASANSSASPSLAPVAFVARFVPASPRRAVIANRGRYCSHRTWSRSGGSVYLSHGHDRRHIRGQAMRMLRVIETPWAPYSVTFSRDGTRLAVGGGSWYGEGGLMLIDLASGQAEVLDTAASASVRLSVSGVCFSPDDRHLAASTWSSGHHHG